VRKNSLKTLVVASAIALTDQIYGGEEPDVERFDYKNCVQDRAQAENLNCQHHFAVAEDFAEYAIMAADTYRSMNRLDWLKLRRESLEVKLKNSRSDEPSTAASFAGQMNEAPAATEASPENKAEQQEEEAQDDQQWDEASSLQYGKHQYYPQQWKALEYKKCAPIKQKDSRGKQVDFETELPLVIPGWERLFDFDRGAPPPRFLSFVPGLFVEVWVRERKSATNSTYAEYAIVFRGTQEGGGIFSNLRFLTSTLLLFHDQYDQARRLFPRLREQIKFREEEKSIETGKQREAPMITLVGHSLGAGLAMHVAVHHEGVHRIIGFNPSPVTGFFAKNYCERADNLRTVQSVHFVYESSEALHYLDSRKHGDLIDPALTTTIQFHKVNLIGSDAFKQHAIGPMACKLAVIKRDLGPSMPRQSPRLADEKIERKSLKTVAPATDEERQTVVLLASRRKMHERSCEIPVPAYPSALGSTPNSL